MNGVSLFANVGIAETYIKNHNIDIVVANELLEKRVYFYKEHHKNCDIIQGDITNPEIFNKILNKERHLNTFVFHSPSTHELNLSNSEEAEKTAYSFLNEMNL